MTTTKPRGTAKPSKRLQAQTPAIAGQDAAPRSARAKTMPVAAEARLPIDMPTRMRVATKFVVTDKTEQPVVVDRQLRTHFYVKLEAVYEARPILNGLATEQGNADNRIFGDDRPDATIGMWIHSKAIADTFRTGRAFGVVFEELP